MDLEVYNSHLMDMLPYISLTLDMGFNSFIIPSPYSIATVS